MLTACGNNEPVETQTNSETSKDSKPLQIVTTIKPLQSLVLAILGDQLENQASSFQLIPDYASPHSASFKPSDIRKVSQADIIFRIDEHMEVMLNPLLEKHQKKLISLAETEGIALIDWDSLKKARNEILKDVPQNFGFADHDHEGQGHEADENHEEDRDGHDTHESKSDVDTQQIAVKEIEEEHADEEDNENAGVNEHNHMNLKQDMHIWTSPKNAMLMAQKIMQELSRLDPKNQKIYEKNLDSFDNKLGQEAMLITQQLNGKKGIPYIVFHNSWQYFSHEFGLADPIILNMHEGLTSGAKKLSATRLLITELGIRCVFTDPDIAQAQVDTLLSNQTGKEIKVVEIDVLGRKTEPNQDAYLGWLNNMGKAISNCLQ